MLNVIKPDWPAHASVHACTTTRLGGFSSAPYDSLNLATHVGDNADDVKKNRHWLKQAIHLPNEPFWLNQTHSTLVAEAQSHTHLPTADAAFTQQSNIVCAVLTADCLPLLICDRAGSVVAAIHAGWRGLAAGIIENTIKSLPVARSELLVWLGPAIGAQAFEVGKDVIQEFVSQDPQAKLAFKPSPLNNQWLGNLYMLATQRLHSLDISAIYGGNHCTYSENNLFYSFRHDNHTGRMASLIWLTS